MRGAVVAALVVAPGCGVRGLSFVQDDRVDIVAPDDLAEVRLPLTVDWDVEGFEVGEGSGSFGVLVDRAPPPPGRTLEWLFRDDDLCRGPGGAELCGDPQFLVDRGVHRTDASELVLGRVARRTGDDRRRELHEVTVVLLDAEGRRVGEGAWSVEFEIDDEDGGVR